MSNQIIPIVMPKWGLSMKEGILTTWHVEEGETIESGQEIMEVETDKIVSAVEASDGGLLRRKIGEEGEIYPVKGLLGVLASLDISDEEIEAFIAEYKLPEDKDAESDGVASQYEFLETPSGRLRYVARPNPGTPVLLIHGFGGDLDNWLFNIDGIASARAVYALDLPGHGQSFKTMANPSLEAMTDAVEQFMSKLDLPEADMVGHSMGGLIIANLALRRKEAVKSLTLVSPAGLGKEINTEYINGFVSASSRRELKPYLKFLFADSNLVSRAMVEDLLKYKRLDGVQATLEALATSMFAGGNQATVLTDQLATLPRPIQVIWGAKDAIIPVSHAHTLPNAQVEIIEKVGHMAQLEAASQVNELILAQATQ